ncbi:DUF1080 domain-containing protein [uncultured Algibacter sp.]|uniref:3-keto-disaccharide hydrolase n=1 Tax=uncultured Algibacter sp. TaxID=298659 RepID=UPI0026328B0E|nr:DUF1080 domain-containing protein [uncultured Algibacter sp.]
MKKCLFIVLLVICFVSCKNESKNKNNAVPNSVNESIGNEISSKWIVLFDGTSLDSWKGYLSDDVYEEWTIDDGVLVFTPSNEGGKNIITKNKYTNFVLSVEWKISEGGNSGIFWGVYEDEKYKEAYETGAEIQVLDNDKHPDSFVAEDTHKAGSLYDLIGYSSEFINPAGEWNVCVLEINHNTNQGKVSMNGHDSITFPVHGADWDAMVAKSKFKDWEGFAKYQTGHIGLQDHGDKVSYRNIKIKEL